MTAPRLESVNIANPEPIGNRSQNTGIFKRPGARPVLIDTLGAVGDAVVNRKHHGGPDQAVYLYLRSDYEWWERELGHSLTPGSFGENLTIENIAGEDLSVGDRFAIGDVLLEVTSHRTPCNTFALKMGDPHWVRRFFKGGRPGAYLRVLSTGWVEAGDAVDYRPFAGEKVRVSELLALEGLREIEVSVLERALKAPLHFKMRSKLEARLAAPGL